MPENGMTIISNFIETYYYNDSPKFWSQLLQYKAHSGPFNNSSAWKSACDVDIITWWKGNFSSVTPELTRFVVCILSIPTSSAASERNWTTFSYIHDRKRNKLTPEHVFKLVYIYFNYKLKNSNNIDDTIINRDQNDRNYESDSSYNEDEDIDDEGTITEGIEENGSDDNDENDEENKKNKNNFV